MTDYILEIAFDARDAALEETIQSRLFLTASTGSSTSTVIPSGVEGSGREGRTARATRPDPSTHARDDRLVVSAYFDTPGDRDVAANMLRGLDLRLTEVERERLDWLDVYQQSLVPIVIGERFIVTPDAALIPDDNDRLTIVVPQEQAFGTGSHETTSLCVEILESLDMGGKSAGGKRGLDVGAGSGILAIAMHRLGAAKAIAFDNDPDAFGALRDNRNRNGVPDAAMPLFIGGVEALRGGAFDIVTMNIIPEVILPLLGDVVRRMAPDARLLLSGILLLKRDDVVSAATSHGLALVDERAKGEWWAGVFRQC